MLLPLLVALAAATPDASAVPTAAAPAAVAAKPAQKAAADEMVCKTEQVTGSMFPKKIWRKKTEAYAQRAEEPAQIRANQRTVTAPQR